MRYLIDTNIFLFYAFDNYFLNNDTREILTDYENIIYISSESVKETIHLFQTDRIKTKKWKTATDIVSFIEQESDFLIDYVRKEHLRTFAGLELVANHNDPSDRLIIAQAITERMPLISSDRIFAEYRRQGLQFIYNKK
jgi:PIN domain nuclease of toxin-antitoxin system